jgi:Phosphoesterase family
MRASAIIVNWDDSDGWYDHQMSPIINSSAALNGGDTKNDDQLNSPGKCGQGSPLKDDYGDVIQGRCGYGPHIPLLVIITRSAAAACSSIRLPARKIDHSGRRTRPARFNRVDASGLRRVRRAESCRCWRRAPPGGPFRQRCHILQNPRPGRRGRSWPRREAAHPIPGAEN